MNNQRLTSGITSGVMLCCNYYCRKGNVYIFLREEHSVPPARSSNYNEQCSLSHVRPNVWYLRRSDGNKRHATEVFYSFSRINFVASQIYIERRDLLQSTLLRGHCLLLLMPGAQCFRSMLHFSWQRIPHVSFLDLISRSEDIDRKFYFYNKGVVKRLKYLSGTVRVSHKKICGRDTARFSVKEQGTWAIVQRISGRNPQHDNPIAP